MRTAPVLPTQQPPLLITVPAAAALLSTSRRTIERLLHHGRLPRRKLGSRTLIPRSAIEQLARRDTPHIGGGAR